MANEGRDESDGCATQSPPSRASSTCCRWRATQPATTGTCIPGDESRPTERGREHSPLDTTPVGWLWHRARKPPARQPRQPPSSSRTRIRMFCTCGVEEERKGGCGKGEGGKGGLKRRNEERRDAEDEQKRDRLDYLGATMTASGVTGLGLG